MGRRLELKKVPEIYKQVGRAINEAIDYNATVKTMDARAVEAKKGRVQAYMKTCSEDPQVETLLSALDMFPCVNRQMLAEMDTVKGIFFVLLITRQTREYLVFLSTIPRVVA